MAKELDANITMDELALRMGRLLLQLWMHEKKIAVLEQRVDELDPPEPEIKQAATPANKD